MVLPKTKCANLVIETTVEPFDRRVRAWLRRNNSVESSETTSNGNQTWIQRTNDGDDSESPTVICERSFGSKNNVMQRKIHGGHFKYRQERTEKVESVSSSSSDFASRTTRRLYTRKEHFSIIQYIVENDAYTFIKGNILWQKMELEKICKRSWQSMKDQFMRKIYPNINGFELPEEQTEKFTKIMMRPARSNSCKAPEPGQRGWRRNANFYRRSEDVKILNFLLQKKRYYHVQKLKLWQRLEKKNIIPGRSWESLQSRFKHFILPNIESYCLMQDEMHKLGFLPNRGTRQGKSVHHTSSASSSRTSGTTGGEHTWEKQKQHFRKAAVQAGVMLAETVYQSKVSNQPANGHQAERGPGRSAINGISQHTAKPSVFSDSKQCCSARKSSAHCNVYDLSCQPSEQNRQKCNREMKDNGGSLNVVENGQAPQNMVVQDLSSEEQDLITDLHIDEHQWVKDAENIVSEDFGCNVSVQKIHDTELLKGLADCESKDMMETDVMTEIGVIPGTPHTCEEGCAVIEGVLNDGLMDLLEEQPLKLVNEIESQEEAAIRMSSSGIKGRCLTPSETDQNSYEVVLGTSGKSNHNQCSLPLSCGHCSDEEVCTSQYAGVTPRMYRGLKSLHKAFISDSDFTTRSKLQKDVSCDMNLLEGMESEDEEEEEEGLTLRLEEESESDIHDGEMGSPDRTIALNKERCYNLSSISPSSI